ncbi:isoprenoid biosynthesis glyoxalase ElbB [bacterium]|nr:isoprenoid biosynthesis glyoxalase ElbB [bacterium]
MSKKIGVLLAGCGVFDGSEIHEAVITLLAIDRAGAEAICIAPNIEQMQVVNHLTQKPVAEKRNVLVESARIARGKIRDLAHVSAADLDALVLPGGYGAAKNLSDFGIKGADATVQKEVQRILVELNAAGKPIGAICIAPATLTKALAHKHPEVTIGSDAGTADAIERMGGKHVHCTVEEIQVDHVNKLVTTPAYMLGPGIKDIALGIEKLVNQIVTMI